LKSKTPTKRRSRIIEPDDGTLTDRAYRELEEMIVTLQLSPGTVLSEQALAVQRQFDASDIDVPKEARLLFRIGIHVGDVIEKADGTVYGDGVNVAARLQSLAKPGGIAVSQVVHAVVEQSVVPVPETGAGCVSLPSAWRMSAASSARALSTAAAVAVAW